jgi:hypothetical protein
MRVLGILITSFVFLVNGLSALDTDGDRTFLLRLHARERQAHLQGNANLLATGLADRIVNVENGEVEIRSRQEVRHHFAEYFGRVKYTSWDDVQPPIVRISPDKHMAWMVIQIKAQLADTSGPRAGKPREFISSWISTFEKQDGEWRMIAVSSGLVEK